MDVSATFWVDLTLLIEDGEFFSDKEGQCEKGAYSMRRCNLTSALSWHEISGGRELLATISAHAPSSRHVSRGAALRQRLQLKLKPGDSCSIWRLFIHLFRRVLPRKVDLMLFSTIRSKLDIKSVYCLNKLHSPISAHTSLLDVKPQVSERREGRGLGRAVCSGAPPSMG